MSNVVSAILLKILILESTLSKLLKLSVVKRGQYSIVKLIEVLELYNTLSELKFSVCKHEKLVETVV